MIPKSVSASSLEVAGKCLARYNAEHILYGKQIQGNAAGTGLVCHGALEDFLRGVFIRKDMQFTWEWLQHLVDKHYAQIFGTDKTRPEYADATTLCKNWMEREGQYERLAEVKILSLESKQTFPVPYYVDGERRDIPFNYVMDRLEQVDDKTIRVVDYKSNRIGLSEASLRKKKQARYYALAVQIKFPWAERIIVEFDFLRHFPVSTEFTKQDNVDTWNELKQSVEKIINTPAEGAPETLNSDCVWCIRKADCKALLGHVAAGGNLSKDVNELADLFDNLTNQAKAINLLKDEIEARLLTHAAENDVLEFDTANAKVEVQAKTQRKVNPAVAAAILGPRASQFAGFTVTTITKLLRKNDPTLTPQEKILMKAALDVEIVDPKIKVTPKDPYL